jgi:hypothetical protein
MRSTELVTVEMAPQTRTRAGSPIPSWTPYAEMPEMEQLPTTRRIVEAVVHVCCAVVNPTEAKAVVIKKHKSFLDIRPRILHMGMTRREKKSGNF